MLPFLLAAVAVSAIAGVWDYRTGRIPNWLTVGGIFVGVTAHAVSGAVTQGLRAGLQAGGLSLAGVAFCALSPLVLFWKGGMGGGDVKLFAALGAFLHPLLGIEAQLYGLVIAALAAPVRLVYEGQLLRVLANSVALLANPFRAPAKRRSVPDEVRHWFRLGPSIFLGTLTTLVAHLYALTGP